MEQLSLALVIAHISFGGASLAGAMLAIATQLTSLEHRWHRIGGQLFYYSMAGIFATGIPMSILNRSISLFFIALFSFYLAWMGVRYARNRKGTATGIDRAVVTAAVGVFGLMVAYGIYVLTVIGSSYGIVVIIFGGIGLANAVGDLRIIRGGGVTGVQRIVEHLGKMLGGTIAITTAFAVINIQFQPAFVVWLAPAAILTPAIIIWSRQLQSRSAMPGSQ